MMDVVPTMTLSPQAGLLLTKITDTPDLETALWRVLHDYTGLKIQQLAQQIEAFERKWGMTFEEFSQRSELGTLGQDPYAYDVESDFWDWEKAVTLIEHYEASAQLTAAQPFASVSMVREERDDTTSNKRCHDDGPAGPDHIR